MPKYVDHGRRRRELADAVCRVVAREGVEGASLRRVAEECGWSIGAMRYYFATKRDLLVFAVHHAGDRIEERVERLPADSTPLERLRGVMMEMLPLDADRRSEARVWLAFVVAALVDPALMPAAEAIWRRLHEPFVRLVGESIRAGELPASLEIEREATRLQALVDGLVVHLVTAPDQVPPERAMSVIDEHLAGLRHAAR